MKKVRPRVINNQLKQRKMSGDHKAGYIIQDKNSAQNIEIANKIIKYLQVEERF